jgi:hypothetical protein
MLSAELLPWCICWPAMLAAGMTWSWAAAIAAAADDEKDADLSTP